MRTTSAVVAVVAATGMLATGVVPASAAKPSGTIQCTVYLTEQPGGTELKGVDKGPLACGQFGAGAQRDTFAMVFNAAKTGGTGLVKFTDTYKTGTVSGTWKLTFKVSGMAVALRYAVKYTGGTGAYKGIQGSGSGQGNLTSMTTGTFTYKVTV